MRTKSRASSRLKWEVSEDGAARRPRLQRFVVSFLFTPLWKERREVLLIRKQHPTWQRHSLNGLGGRVFEDEPEDKAAFRTVLEECDLDFSGQLSHFARCVWVKSSTVLDCYTGMDHSVYNARSLKDEKVSRYGYPEVLTRKDLVSGVSWLMPLAIDFNLNKVGEPPTVQMM